MIPPPVSGPAVGGATKIAANENHRGFLTLIFVTAAQGIDPTSRRETQVVG